MVDDRIIERSELCATGGSDRLLPWVQQVLREGGTGLPQLDAIACGAGPGSFTGIRLACGIAQGLAYGADLPVVSIGTLEALAFAQGPGRILVCMDARMNEVYHATYDVAGDEVDAISEPQVCPPELLPLPAGKGWKACGDGFASYAETLTRRLGNTINHVDAIFPPLAAWVARLAARQVHIGNTLLAAQAMPLYVRDKVALTTPERMARGGSK